MPKKIKELNEKALITRTAWQSIEYALIKSSALSGKSGEQIFTTLVNEFNTGRSAVYHGHPISQISKIID